jgi:hypothetical protein
MVRGIIVEGKDPQGRPRKDVSTVGFLSGEELKIRPEDPDKEVHLDYREDNRPQKLNSTRLTTKLISYSTGCR